MICAGRENSAPRERAKIKQFSTGFVVFVVVWALNTFSGSGIVSAKVERPSLQVERALPLTFLRR